MTQQTIILFINEIYCEGRKQNYILNKTVVNQIDDNWSVNILALEDYGPENNRGF